MFGRVSFLLSMSIFVFLSPLMAVGEVDSVSISLTTKVPAVLIHGFLTENTQDLVAETSVDNAFAGDGVSLTYGIKTNTVSALKVVATITPFNREGDEDVPATVEIASVAVDDVPKARHDGVYELFDLTPSGSGMQLYAYTLTIVADQTDVATAPSGTYSSTLSIDIESL